MKKQITTGLLIVLTPFAFSNMECSKDCGFALCDLVTEILFETAATISAGDRFNVPNLIRNIRETTETCKGDVLETLSARESQSRLKIDYDADGNGSFETNEINDRFFVPEIPPGSSAQENYNFLFGDPGVYRLITFADDMDDNEERDEGNNASAPEDAIAGRSSEPIRQPLIITVLPNPDFQREEGEPRVRILSRTVTIQ